MAMRLVSLGVPWAEAFSMSKARRLACLVVLGEFEGRNFDWRNMSWIDP